MEEREWPRGRERWDEGTKNEDNESEDKSGCRIKQTHRKIKNANVDKREGMSEGEMAQGVEGGRMMRLRRGRVKESGERRKGGVTEWRGLG